MHHEEALSEIPEAELQTARQRAEELVREAERYAETQRESAERQCSELLQESTSTLNAAKLKAKKLVEEAERYADELRKAATPMSASDSSNFEEWITIVPEEVAGATFSVVRRGYDPSEVDEFLSVVASNYEIALAKIQLAVEGAFDPRRAGKEITDILQAADNAAQQMKTKAREEADELVRAASIKSQRADNEIARISRMSDEKLAAAEAKAKEIESVAKKKASREASKEIEEAKKYARELRESAERRSNALVAEMQRRQDEGEQLEEEMIARMAKIDELVQQLKAHFEMPDVIDLRDSHYSGERESARDLKRA